MVTTLRRTGGRLAALSAVLLAVSCAGAGGGGAGRAPGGRIAPGTVANGQLTPGRPAAPSYGTYDAPCQASGVITNAMSQLAAAAQRAGKQPPELDPSVCGVAETFLGWDPQAQGSPRFALLQFVSSWFGVPGIVMPPAVAVIGPLPGSAQAELSNEEQIAERLVQAIGPSVLAAVQPRLGIAVQRSRKGMNEVAYKIAATVADVPVKLDPLPRHLAAGQQATLSGRLLGGMKNPKVLVSDAAGQLSVPEQAPGEGFKAELKCGDRPGRIQVEIRGELEGSPQVAASFPVACGGEPPTTVAIVGEQWPTDAAAAEKKMIGLVNAERAAAGLKPLGVDAAVSAIARDIAADIAARGVGGGSDMAERLKKEGIASPLILLSPAADRTFERAHGRLVASPTNRANIMNPDVTTVGIGSFEKTDPEGRKTVFVTEIFLKELPPVDAAQMRQQLRDAVAQKRKDARTNALADDPRLDDVAQRFAQALADAGGTLAKEQQTALTSPLNTTFRTVTMVSGAKQEALDFAEEPQTTAPGQSLGVGVALGKHPVLGRSAAYVVLMVGTPKDAAGAGAAPAKKKPAATKPKK